MLHDEEISNYNSQPQDSRELEQKTFFHTPQTNKQTPIPKKRILKIPTQATRIIKTQNLQPETPSSQDSTIPQNALQTTDAPQDTQSLQDLKNDHQNFKLPKTHTTAQKSLHTTQPPSQQEKKQVKKHSHIPTTQQEFAHTAIKIQIENRAFSLNLENFNKPCRDKIQTTFAQKQYTLEELLTMFIVILRDQTLAEIELLHILGTLES